MRSLFLVICVTLYGTLTFGQPGNDNCDGLIDLGAVPTCSTDIYTNVDATPTDIGFGNNPACFNGGTVQNDVWFSFTTTTELVDVSIILLGSDAGANGIINNPQIALYRGDCVFDGLAELSCLSSAEGSTSLQMDVLGLSANTTYFIRVDAYSSTGAPSFGDFTLCVEEYIPAINIGDVGSTTACFGTLYDSGGLDGDYGPDENATFTICPTDVNSCINIDLVDYAVEPFFGFFGDQLNIFAGADITAPLITSISGFSLGNPFPVQATSDCVTIQFISDASVQEAGFELTWQCSPTACSGSGIDNPTPIGSLPFNSSGSTCDGAATFATSPCTNDAFLNGPETVFIYESPGGICADVQVTNASFGTGVLVLNGAPGAPGTTCVAQSTEGLLGAVNFQNAGTYYIVVANGVGCTDFDIAIQESECSLSPALVDALCNPLNGCIEEGGVPSIFDFEDGFQDIDVVTEVNGGCWLGFGAEPDFYWFTIEAQADGQFGFILESADTPSDIDFNVWGPFTQEEVCETPDQIITFIQNNQPVRSSWAAGADPTGLADIHPVLGTEVTDEYDCANGPGADGDDFVRTIDVQEGEVYAILVNDWGDQIGAAGISVDWGPSTPEVLAPIPPVISGNDTTLCIGESVQILIEAGVDNIQWLNDTTELSCTNCFDPIITPSGSNIYLAAINAVCYVDTIAVNIVVYDVDAGLDATVCRGEEFQIEAGETYDDATYSWTAPTGVTLSCTDCPNPSVTADSPGTYTIAVTLTAPVCTLADDMVLTVLDSEAPTYEVVDDLEICIGETVNIGGTETAGVTYSWSSVPEGFSSTESDPAVSPTETTIYYLEASNTDCPFPSTDSVLVSVFENPALIVLGDTAICQGQTIQLGNMEVEPGVTYQWTGPGEIEDPNIANAIAMPTQGGTYTLTATRGACVVSESFDVTITPIAIDLDAPDTLTICRGTAVDLNAAVVPDGAVASWTPNNGSLSSITGNNVVATPQTITTYYAMVEVPGCFEVDSITIVVDSIPANLDILPADTTICQGEIVVLTTPPYEPSDFPDLEILWDPTIGAQSGDSLLNFVVTPDTTVTYSRIVTNGVCVDTTFATVNVTPIPILRIEPADTTVCVGEPVSLVVVAEEPGILPQLEELMWMPETGISCTECLDPTVTAVQSTTYSFSAEFEGCPTGASATVNVIGENTYQFPTDRVICQGESIQLNFISLPGVEYAWTADPNFESSDPLLEVTPTETTTYFLTTIVGGCIISDQLTIEVIPPATLEAGISDDLICQGDEVTLTASANVAGDFSWVGENGFTATGETVTDTPNSTTTYTVTFIAAGNCDTLLAVLSVQVDPIVVLSPITLDPDENPTPQGNIIELSTTALPDIPGTIYTWTANGEPVAGGDGLSISAQLLEETTFVVTSTTPSGCTFSTDVVVGVIRPEFGEPSVFSPDGDGTNDFFNITTGGVIDQVVSFQVFNRWGQVVYDNETPDQGWDGNFNGNPQPMDVYIYRVVLRLLDGTEESFSGDVTLIR